MKILITGGCGFLGSNLAAEAIRRNVELTVFDNLGRKGSSENLSWLRELGAFSFAHGDVRNSNDVERVISDFKPDTVFHLAGQVAMTTSLENPRMDFETNALGTLNVLDTVRKYCPEAAVLYSSTNKVYGDLEQFQYMEDVSRYRCLDYPLGFNESVSLDFRSPYGCSKGAADQYMLDFARMYGLKTVVFRHSSMYGGRQFATADQGWVGWFCQKCVEAERGTRQPFTISGNGKQVRDVLHADDMMRLYFDAVENIELVRGHAFNIGGGIENSLSLIELFECLESITGASLAYRKLPVRQSDQKVFVADIKKIGELTGWRPQVSAHEGVRRMVDWAREIS